ncbi:hypothetical protein B0T17DRAFT_50389 [Bombardia bombarda]|uniref:Uncharacterized protein n=1 Tax=Bombardia bombarda TaxID=252184 RepID=A0AA40CET2_9PEZI|nr:hypothetical protein B0T17DRAFT_50389 [Bombardia bombarda]
MEIDGVYSEPTCILAFASSYRLAVRYRLIVSVTGTSILCFLFLVSFFLFVSFLFFSVFFCFPKYCSLISRGRAIKIFTQVGYISKKEAMYNFHTLNPQIHNKGGLHHLFQGQEQGGLL